MSSYHQRMYTLTNAAGFEVKINAMNVKKIILVPLGDSKFAVYVDDVKTVPMNEADARALVETWEERVENVR